MLACELLSCGVMITKVMSDRRPSETASGRPADGNGEFSSNDSVVILGFSAIVSLICFMLSLADVRKVLKALERVVVLVASSIYQGDSRL
jgi:hypothetical protein